MHLVSSVFKQEHIIVLCQYSKKNERRPTMFYFYLWRSCMVNEIRRLYYFNLWRFDDENFFLRPRGVWIIWFYDTIVPKIWLLHNKMCSFISDYVIIVNEAIQCLQVTTGCIILLSVPSDVVCVDCIMVSLNFLHICRSYHDRSACNHVSYSNLRRVTLLVIVIMNK